MQTKTTQQAEQHVEAHFREHIDEKYFYHNMQHTRDVREAAERMGIGYALNAEDQEDLILAALFHDTGFDEGSLGHELRGRLHAHQYLIAKHHPAERIANIEALIEATQIGFKPRNLLEEILRDADYSHLGSELYWDRCSRVRQELLMTRQNFMTEDEWVEFELDFMTKHQYHTELARQYFEEGKLKNIKQLKKYQQRIQPGEENEEGERPKKKKKKWDPNGLEFHHGRGVETMYRNIYRTHLDLSAIADNKANIMLSVNAIIISIVASSLMPQFRSHPELIAPTFLLLVVCLTALVFAILSTQPKITTGVFTREDIEHKRSNLLFFGNFFNMKLEDFQWGVNEMIKDNEFLYGSMTRDIYFLGKVLAQKYRYLRICFSVFMYGLILAVIAFGVALFFYKF
jgi:predicted metal-dependent HD superfamily phosphohydrolase